MMREAEARLVSTLPARTAVCVILFLLPNTPMLYSVFGEGTISPILGALIMLSAVLAMLTVVGVRVDWPMWLAVALFGSYLLCSSVISGLIAGRITDVRGLLATVFPTLPWFWFLTGGSILAVPGNKRLMSAAYVAGAALSALWYLALITELVGGTGRLVWWSVGPALGFNTNSAGLIYVLGIALALSMDLKSHRWLRVVLKRARAIIIMVLALATIFTFSRSSYLALSAVATYAVLIRIPRRFALIGVVLACGLAFYLLPGALAERVEYTWSHQLGQLDPSTEARLALWTAGVETFLRSPIWGTGVGNWRTSQAGFQGFDSAVLGNMYAHNYFVTLLSQSGLIGFSLFLYLLVRGRRLGRRHHPSPPVAALQLVLAGVIVASLFGEPLFTPWALFVFVVVLAGVSYSVR